MGENLKARAGLEFPGKSLFLGLGRFLRRFPKESTSSRKVPAHLSRPDNGLFIFQRHMPFTNAQRKGNRSRGGVLMGSPGMVAGIGW
jgi:hypothetical protein